MPLPPTAPPGLAFPHGLLRFRLADCEPGAAVTFTVTYPEPLTAGTGYWKYGPEIPGGAPRWYELPATVGLDAVTFSVVDGGLGDGDGAADGEITDPGGPAFQQDLAVPVPMTSPWTLVLLIAALAVLGVRRLRG